MTRTGAAATAAEIRTTLLEFIEHHAKAPVTPDVDLFASGLVSSLFALQLVMRVESAFGVTVEASDLTLDNFRTVDVITELVLRLRGTGDV